MKLDPEGAQQFPAAMSDHAIAALARALAGAAARGSPGSRLRPGLVKSSLIGPATAIAAQFLGPAARPVAAKFFDKNPARNWSLGWHQDRTIALRARHDVDGYAHWTVKTGIHHCVPPFEILAGMLTLRIHLDAVSADNGPLLVVPGSHRLGSIAEPDIVATVDRLGTGVCLARRGDIWLYAAPILHRSDRSASPARRRVLQLSYSADDLHGGLEWLGV